MIMMMMMINDNNNNNNNNNNNTLPLPGQERFSSTNAKIKTYVQITKHKIPGGQDIKTKFVIMKYKIRSTGPAGEVIFISNAITNKKTNTKSKKRFKKNKLLL